MRSIMSVVFCTLILILCGCAQEAVETLPDQLVEAEEPKDVDASDAVLPDIPGLSFSEDEFPRMDGSTSTMPLGEAIAAFMMGKDRNECKKYADFTGTNEAYKQLADGDTDILVVYEMPDDAAEYIKEKGVELEIAPIGADGLVFIVNEQNPIENLTTQQIVGIYAGDFVNWQEVGGEHGQIAVFRRNDSSGSHTLMKKLVMHDTPLRARENHIVDTMLEIITSIAEYENGRFAIGYNVYYYVNEMKKDPNIKILSIDGVYPSNDTIASGEYPFVNYFYAVIRKDAAKNSSERLLFDWLQTDEGQALIYSENYVAIQKGNL